MKNKIDFIYAYSDLNMLKTRVQILTGKYKDTILEFGGSVFSMDTNPNTFCFEYELFHIPYAFKDIKLKGDKEFEVFLGNLLVDVISAKRNDPNEDYDTRSSFDISTFKCSIKIDDKFYPNWIETQKKQPIAEGLKGF